MESSRDAAVFRSRGRIMSSTNIKPNALQKISLARSSRQFRFSSRRILTSTVGEDLCFHLLEHRKHLRAFHTWKTVEKDFDGISGFEVIEKTLYGHTRAFEHQRAPKKFRIGMINALFSHAINLVLGISICKHPLERGPRPV